MTLAFSQACENNKTPILAVLSDSFANVSKVLEIGSGTGQHAAFFAQHLPQLEWQPSDRHDFLDDLKARCAQTRLTNLITPFAFDVEQPWLLESCDAVFTANSLHIMSWDEVEHFFSGVGSILTAGGLCCVYGPFNYKGQYTSDSNARFDQWLKDRDSLSGVRDYEAVNALAEQAGLQLLKDQEMPANNRCLLWQKQ